MFGQGPLPTGCGCGKCRRGNPSPTPQRVVLRAGFPRCGGGARVPGGGRLLPGCGASGVGRPPTPNRPSFGAGGRGPLPTGCGCGGCGRGNPSPSPQRALLRASFAPWWGGHEGARGGRSCLGAGRPGSGALLPPTARPLGRGAGAHYPLAVGAGAAGVRNTSPTPQRALLRAGFARCGSSTRAPGGGASILGLGRPGSSALPSPTTRPFECGRGPLPTGCGCGKCGRGDSSPTPQRALLRAGVARCGGGTRAPGGAPLAWVRGVRGQALSHPQPPVLWGVRPGPTTHWLWVRGCGPGEPSPTPQRAFLRASFAPCRGGVRVPGGGALAWVWGVRGRALSHPRALVLSGVRLGPTTHWLLVRGMRRGDPSPTPERALLRAGFARCGMRHEGARGGAPLAWVWGARGRALSHPRPLVFWGVRPGPTTHWLWVREVRAWGPVTNRTARAPASWLCALCERHEGAQGGRLLPGCGASRVGRSPTPNRPSFGACGRGPLPTGCGCGGCGLRDPSPTPQRALLRAGLAPSGSSTRAPGGALLAWVWGVRGQTDTHTQTPRPGIAGRSRSPSSNTHTHTAHPSQEWRGASGVRTPAHTHPNTLARTGGAQPKPEPKHTHPRRTPQPGVAGYRGSTHTNTHTPIPQPEVAGRSRNPSPNTHTHAAHPSQEWLGNKESAHTSTHTPQHPSQEWRGAPETRTHTHTPRPHTTARSGGVQGWHPHQHTHTHQHTSKARWGAAESRSQTHTPTPHAPARSGGIQGEHAHQHAEPQHPS